MSHNPRITPQFKQECVAFALKHANRTLLSIAKELNVSKSALSRWVREHQHFEAISSRPLLLHGVATQTRHAGQTRLTITSTHAKQSSIQAF